MTSFSPPAPISPDAIPLADRQRLLAELDAMLEQVNTLMARFEATGFTIAMRDDYVALHRLQARMFDEREQHRRALVAAGVAVPDQNL